MVLSSEKKRKFYVFLYLAKRKKNSQLDILLFIRVALLYHLSFLSYSFQTAHVLRDVKKFRKRFLPIEVLSFFFFFFSKNESMNLYDIISMSNEVIAFCNSISFLRSVQLRHFFFFLLLLHARVSQFHAQIMRKHIFEITIILTVINHNSKSI